MNEQTRVKARTTPVAFITSLLATLSNRSVTHSVQSKAGQLDALSETARTLMLTLHVLFPHALLDALDMLDRGLVVKLVHAGDRGQDGLEMAGASDDAVEEIGGEEEDEEEDEEEHEDEDESNGRAKREDVTWHVLSSQSLPPDPPAGSVNRFRNSDRDIDRDRWQRSRHTHSSYDYNGDDDERIRAETERAAVLTATQSYAVHLRAWNCSCPAFAFAAYSHVSTSASAALPRNAAVGGERAGDGNGNGDENGHADGRDEEMLEVWQRREDEGLPFGGLARRQGRVPVVCKHLLACVLAETCEGMFGAGVHSVRSEHAGTGGSEGTPRYDGRGHVQSGSKGRKGVVIRVMESVEEVAAWAGGGVFL
jgi:hypothetical protein